MSSGRDIKAVALGNLSPFILKGGHPPNGCAVTAECDGGDVLGGRYQNPAMMVLFFPFLGN